MTPKLSDSYMKTLVKCHSELVSESLGMLKYPELDSGQHDKVNTGRYALLNCHFFFLNYGFHLKLPI